MIELLIAAAIAGLLLTAVFAVFTAVLNTVAAQTRWREKAMPAIGALDAISRDLACLVVPSCFTGAPLVASFPADGKMVTNIRFYSAFSTGSSNDRSSYSIGHIDYSLEPADEAGEFRLVRACKPFRVPSRNVFSTGRETWPGIRQFSVAFYDGAVWTNQWENAKNSNSVPKAARIKLTSGAISARGFESEVFIYAGHQISPPKIK